MLRYFCFLFGVVILLPVTNLRAYTNASLSLKQTFKTALEKNRQIRVSREKLRQTQQDVDTATSNLYPQLSIQGNYVRQKETELSSMAVMPPPDYQGGLADKVEIRSTKNTINPPDYMGYSLQLEQHIYQLGKVWSGRKMAKYQAQAAKYRHFRTKQQILLKVTQKYFEVLLARRQIEIAQNMLKRAKRQLAQAKSMLEVGKATKTAVLRAKVQVADAKEQMERARNKYQVAKKNLALEMGRNSLQETEIKEPSKQKLNAKSPKQLFEMALNNRRDLREAKKKLQSAKENVDWEKADFFPKVGLRGEYSGRNEPAFGGEKDTWQASLVVSYPLFTGGKRSAELDKAYSRLREAKASLRRLKREIRVKVRSVYLDVKTQREVIQHLKDSVKSARANYEQVVSQFKAGLASSVDQTNAFTTLNEVKSRLASAFYQYQLDLFRLKSAKGTLAEDLL